MNNGKVIALIKGLGGSGGGADILNADGIIKQEVLPEGYPYASVGFILPEVTVETPDGQGYITDAFELTVGNTYTVNWNGTDYECVAQELNEGGMAATTLGNIGAITGGTDTGEPFIIAGLQPEMGAYGGVYSLDGSTSATLSISGVVYQPMKVNYLPKVKIFDLGVFDESEYIISFGEFDCASLYNHFITAGTVLFKWLSEDDAEGSSPRYAIPLYLSRTDVDGKTMLNFSIVINSEIKHLAFYSVPI